MSEWIETTLGEFISLQRGHDLPSQRRSNGNVPVMGSFGLTGWHSEARAKGPGVTIGRSGASIGVVNYIDCDYWPLNTCLYSTDFHGNNPRFAYYLLKTLDLAAHNSGSAQPSLNRNFIALISIRVPPRPEQDHIANLLGSLDDKIELNRRMNETLEAMAQAIFRDWFVDFGPTRRKLAGITDPVEIMGGLIQDASRAAELAALFPEALGDNGLPEGWTEVSLGHLAVQTTESVSPRDYAEEIFAHFSIPAYDEGKAPKLEKGASILSNKTIVPDGAVLLSKLNPEIERVWLVPRSSTHRQICSTEFLVYQPSPSANTSYLYCLFREPSFREMLKGMATGTSKSHQRVSPKSLAQRNVTFSGSEIITAFGQIVDDLLRRTLHNREEQRTLAAIRDLLLPKLISGEIRLRDAEKIAEAAQ